MNFASLSKSIKKVIKLSNEASNNSKAMDLPKGLHIGFLSERLIKLMPDL